jgi:hypothetical protein
MPALLSLVLLGCSEDEFINVDAPNEYLNGNTPATILEDFRRSWVNRDIEHYATLFADDFAFYFDPSTLEENPTLPTFWGRDAELEAVGNLFASEDITDIRLQLTYDPVPVPVEELGREGWLRIIVTVEKFEIDRWPQPGEEEGTTILVEGQEIQFYFRKGKTEDDTLASSATSGKYFIVRWEDFGIPGATSIFSNATVPATWGRVKAMFR